MSVRLRRLVSRLTLMAFFGALLAPVAAGVHLSWADDAACADAPDFGPRHSNTFAKQHDPIEAGHCAVCHWMRAVSGAAPRPAVSHVVSLMPGASRVAVAAAGYAQAFSLEQPSRAPPASLPL